MSGRGPACVKFTRGQGGAVGCTLGLAPHVFVGAYGDDAADALSKAGAIAAKLQSWVDENPAAAAGLALLPGGAYAFGAIAAASALYKSGASVDDVKRQIGPIAAKVTKSILSIF